MSQMLQQGSTQASTYSFSSKPKAVSGNRKKYREPSETDAATLAMYRDLKETCISWDKRVHRGNTYSMYTQNAIKEALEDVSQDHQPTMRRKRVGKEKNPFDMPLPEAERIPVDLTNNLVAREPKIEVETVEAQTDEFLPEPPAEMYRPQKTGIDTYTQVEDGELFHFDTEVEPILDVIINKTLEQSIMEVEEEHELESMATFKSEWYRRQEQMMKEWKMQVDEEWVRWREKEAVMNRKREQKKREAQVQLKMQAISASKDYLKKVVPNAIGDLQEVAFPDMRAMAINRMFLPQLFSQVQKEVQSLANAQTHVDAAVSNAVQQQHAARVDALQAHREKTKELDRRKLEERNIRQGKIRILVDDGAGGKLAVGPIQISSEDSVDAVHDRVFEWLHKNEAKLVKAWQWGVYLLVAGEPIQATTEIFEAKAGQISMLPKPEPPPPPEQDEEAGDNEEGEVADEGN